MQVILAMIGSLLFGVAVGLQIAITLWKIYGKKP
jgi:hypothetical protein